jgi:alpha-acetolactate decarboxylase
MAHTASSDEIPRPPMARPPCGGVVLAVLALALVGFGVLRARGPSSAVGHSAVVLVGTPGTVRTYGSMPELLAGNIEQKVTLGELPSGPGVVAVGSLSGLRGEIAIVRGATWLSYPAGKDGIRIDNDPGRGEGVAFLALADVKSWRAQTLVDAVPFADLATVVEERARRAGVDVSGPVPLLIDGIFSNIELNVTNGPALDGDKPTEDRLRETSTKAKLPNAEGTIVGFFAASGGERLLHAGKRLHLHVVLPAARQVGHLDAAQIEAGAQLHLPTAE